MSDLARHYWRGVRHGAVAFAVVVIVVAVWASWTADR